MIRSESEVAKNILDQLGFPYPEKIMDMAVTKKT
jgi:hypothetical protein